MIDDRITSIIYQSEIYYINLVNDLVEKKRFGKAYASKWEKADTILGYLESLNYRSRLTDQDDIDNVNYILYCLIELCELNQYPVTPVIAFQPAPAVIVGAQGIPGIQGIPGTTGATGLATDIQVGPVAVSSVVDQFTLASAKGVRWDYVVREAGGAQRAGEIIGNWNATGSAIDYFDNSTSDIGGSTAGIEFSVVLSAGNIQLLATITAGSWTVYATRYFIPNNGNGTGPVSAVLPNGNILVGNVSSVATAVVMSGDVTITNAGVAAITANIIVNTDINAAAAIAMTKLAAMTASRAVVTDGSGFLTVSAATAAEVAFLSGVTSNIQTQLNSKLSAATGAISPYVSANFPTANRVAISDGATKLGISSVTTTELGFLAGVASSVQNQINTLTGQVSLKANKIQGAWTTIPLASVAWTTNPGGYHNAEYMIDEFGKMNLRGVVDNTLTPLTAFFSSGWMTSAVKTKLDVVMISSGGVVSGNVLDIDTTGTGVLGVSVPVGSTISLDGTSFWIN